MKLRLFSPRLFLRAVKALERIASHLEELRNVQYRIHGIPGAVTATADDTPDDELVSYTNVVDIVDYQRRVAQRQRDGFPLGEDDLPPVS